MKKKGFTLIELLVVIAIIGLLSTLAVVALNSARLKARDAKRIADIKQIQTALELYYNDNNGYPIGDANNSIILGSDATCLGSDGLDTDCSGATNVYMGLIPTNPTPEGDDYVYSAYLPAGGGNCINAGDKCDAYQITFALEGTTGGLLGTTHTATQIGIQ